MTEEKIREQLEHKLLKLEAQEACRNLMGRYSYYGTAFRNKETVELWAKREDAQLMTPWGSYDGHDGIKACYLEDIGDRSDTRVFEAIKGAVIIHEIDTEVIEVAEDLQTAKAAFLSQGNDTYVDRTENEKVHAKWVWEKYSVDFIMEDGEWKIWHMTMFTDIQCPVGGNWGKDTMYPHEGVEIPAPTVKEHHYTGYGEDFISMVAPRLPEPYDTFANTFSY